MPTPPKDGMEEKIKAHFEANMLDGNDVNNCGGCMISATEVLEYIQEAFPEFAVLAVKEAVNSRTKEVIQEIEAVMIISQAEGRAKLILESLITSFSSFLNEK